MASIEMDALEALRRAMGAGPPGAASQRKLTAGPAGMLARKRSVPIGGAARFGGVPQSSGSSADGPHGGATRAPKHTSLAGAGKTSLALGVGGESRRLEQHHNRGLEKSLGRGGPAAAAADQGEVGKRRSHSPSAPVPRGGERGERGERGEDECEFVPRKEELSSGFRDVETPGSVFEEASSRGGGGVGSSLDEMSSSKVMPSSPQVNDGDDATLRRNHVRTLRRTYDVCRTTYNKGIVYNGGEVNPYPLRLGDGSNSNGNGNGNGNGGPGPGRRRRPKVTREGRRPRLHTALTPAPRAKREMGEKKCRKLTVSPESAMSRISSSAEIPASIPWLKKNEVVRSRDRNSIATSAKGLLASASSACRSRAATARAAATSFSLR